LPRTQDTRQATRNKRRLSTFGAGNRIAWVRSSPSGNAHGLVAAMEYKATTSYTPYSNLDMTLNAVRSYTFKFGSGACQIYRNGADTGTAASDVYVAYGASHGGANPSACDIQNCDYADIHDIAFDDIRIEQDSPVYRHILAEKASAFDPTPLENASPPVFEASVRVIPEYSKDDTRRGRIRDVTLRDIRVTSPDCPKIRLGGYDQDHGTTGVTVRGIYWNGREASKEIGENQQVRPFAEPARFAP
jgi:hypothetical protein